jgi:hypothetical protein
MYDLCRRQNGLSTVLVAAPFNASAAKKIHLAAEDAFQFIFHVNHIEKGPFRIRRECHQNVNITFGSKVISHDRSEQREFDNLPATAEFSDFFLGYVNVPEAHDCSCLIIWDSEDAFQVRDAAQIGCHRKSVVDQP